MLRTIADVVFGVGNYKLVKKNIETEGEKQRENQQNTMISLRLG